MIELALTLQNQLVSVCINGKESHSFSMLDLNWPRTEGGVKAFVSNPREVGANLFQALFKDNSPARSEFDALSKQTERTIALVLESSELDAVAWEYAYNKAKEEYVVEDCAFVRALPENERPANGRLKTSYERIPLLFIPANPLVDLNGEPMRALEEESEWREITKHITASNAGFDLLKMLPAAPEQLQTVMAQFRDGLIVHFSGHGALHEGHAILLFECENGASNPLNAREFVRAIKDKAAIAFLSACQSAVAETTEFSNLARGLVKVGVPFALGMQFNLPDPFAPDISGQFYNYLAHGHSVLESARQARRAVKREHEFYVGMIALYAAHPDEAGELRWNGVGAQTRSTFRPADASDLPSPASGLIGRQQELMRIGTRLTEGKKPLAITLHGAGGIGKTALLRQTLLRFAPSFELTLAIALDSLPSLERVLGQIERFLGLSSPCSNDTKEREVKVRDALTSKRTLLGLDNFETLNHALSDEGSEAENIAKSLHEFFSTLCAEGVVLCVTSRQAIDLPYEELFEIDGLEEKSGGNLFRAFAGSRRDDLTEIQTHEISEAVDGHPLALQLLGSVYQKRADLDPNEFLKKIQSLLSETKNQWTKTKRHISLEACFAFSMDNLPKNEEGEKLRIAISKLSVFTAFFVDFTAAPVLENKMHGTNEEYKTMKAQASKTLHALWERSLLEHATIPMPEENFHLFRVHPALRLFAKYNLPDTDMIYENYWQSMNYLASVAEEQIVKSPLMAQIALRAVPDLIYASGFKLDRDGVLMQYRVSKLLEQFGLFDDSIGLLNKSLEICERLGEMQGKSAALNQIGRIYMTRGDLEQAMRWFQQALEIAEKLNDLQNKSYTLGTMAGIYLIRDDLDGAMKLYQQSRDIQDRLSDLWGKSTTLGNMAQIYITRGDLDEAMRLDQQALDIKVSLGDLKGAGDVAHEMAFIFAMRGNLEGAIELYQMSLEIKQGLGDQHGQAVTIGEMASIFVKRGSLDEAMKLYQHALEIAERLGDQQTKSGVLNQMAGIFVTRGDLDGAMKLYRQSLEIMEELGFPQVDAITLGMIGKALWASGVYGKAIACLLSGLMQLVQLKIEPQTQKAMASDLIEWRQEIGIERFEALWKEEIGQPIPEWLLQSPQERFIIGAIQSAREKRPEVEEYFKSAQKMAADSSVPAEWRELGRVLSRILAGDMKVDLSNLSEELKEAIRKALK